MLDGSMVVDEAEGEALQQQTFGTWKVVDESELELCGDQDPLSTQLRQVAELRSLRSAKILPHVRITKVNSAN